MRFDEAPHLFAPSARQGFVAGFETFKIAAHVNCNTSASDYVSILAEKIVVVQFPDAKRVEPGFGDEDDVG